MRVFQDPNLVSGFVYEDPLPTLPALTHCGEAIAGISHSIPTHRHRGFEFMYLASGSYTWRVGRQEQLQDTGDLFVALPQQSHATGRLPHGTQSHQLWAGVNLQSLDSPSARHLAQTLHAAGGGLLPACREVEPILRSIVQQVVTGRPDASDVTQALLEVLCRLLLQRLAHGSGSGAKAVAGYGQRSYPVLKCLHYLEHQTQRRVPLAELASVAGLGRSQLSERFHREVGESPAAYHLRHRLEAARHALASPEASITSIALMYGFGSSQQFAACFRRAFGMSPKGWRSRGVQACSG